MRKRGSLEAGGRVEEAVRDAETSESEQEEAWAGAPWRAPGPLTPGTFFFFLQGASEQLQTQNIVMELIGAMHFPSQVWRGGSLECSITDSAATGQQVLKKLTCYIDTSFRF